MKYRMTSAEASKLLKKVMDEKRIMRSKEADCEVFNAALQEDAESVRPEYDYGETSIFLDECNKKICAIKHAINGFNLTHTVGETGMTVDQVLVYIPLLTEKKDRLYRMQGRLPKQRDKNSCFRSSSIIDYLYANYDVNKAKEDYLAVCDELAAIQNALDYVNNTEYMEFELPG